MSKIAVGSNVEAYCTKCKLVLAHTIVSLDAKGVKSKRVQCNTCDGEHNFRATKPKSKTTAAKKAKTAKGTTKKTRQSWEDIMKEAADALTGTHLSNGSVSAEGECPAEKMKPAAVHA